MGLGLGGGWVGGGGGLAARVNLSLTVSFLKMLSVCLGPALCRPLRPFHSLHAQELCNRSTDHHLKKYQKS